MSANERQVGGSHYRDLAAAGKGEQHWDMMWRLFREAWFVGCITKYVMRYRKKNGVQDLEKAKHYLEKLIELETAEQQKNDVEGYQAWREGYISTSHETDEAEILKAYQTYQESKR